VERGEASGGGGAGQLSSTDGSFDKGDDREVEKDNAGARVR